MCVDVGPDLCQPLLKKSPSRFARIECFTRYPRYLTGACIEDVNHEIYGGIYSQMIFGESFQEPPPSPAVIGFKTYGGRWLVDDGAVRIDAADGPKLISERAPFTDGQVGVEVRFGDRRGQNAGLIVRVDQPGIGADRFVGYEVSLEPARQTLWLARHRNNFEPIKDVKCDVAIGRWIPLEVRLAGSRLEVLVDGKSVLSHDDGEMALLTGTVGLRAWHRQASYRNLWVKTGKEMERLAFRQAERVPQISGMWRPVQSGHRGGRIRHHEDSTVHGHAVAGRSASFPARGDSGSRIRGSIAGA